MFFKKDLVRETIKFKVTTQQFSVSKEDKDKPRIIVANYEIWFCF